MRERSGQPMRRRAMTMIEVIVVAVILGVLAAVTMPRLVGGEARRVRTRGEEAAQVLTALARRDAMLSQPLALEYSREDGVLRVLVRSTDSNAREMWAEDRLLPRADLRDVVLGAIEADGAQLDPESVRVVLDQFTPRPALRLVLTDRDGRHFVTVHMAATAGQASVVEGDASGRLGGPDPIDFDAQGRDQERW